MTDNSTPRAAIQYLLELIDDEVQALPVDLFPPLTIQSFLDRRARTFTTDEGRLASPVGDLPTKTYRTVGYSCWEDGVVIQAPGGAGRLTIDTRQYTFDPATGTTVFLTAVSYPFLWVSGTVHDPYLAMYHLYKAWKSQITPESFQFSADGTSMGLSVTPALLDVQMKDCLTLARPRLLDNQTEYRL